jgi:hypothetical protein
LLGLLFFTDQGFAAARQDQTESQSTAANKPLPVPPIKRIVLYNSGVGQLQHEAIVDGKQKVRLNFSIENVSDALKSLVISDDGGGSIRSIEYKPAPDPADIAAETIGRPMTVAQLLQSQRGEVVNLTVGTQSITGKIYGVEQRTDSEGTHDTLVLLSEQGLRTLELAKVETFKFDKQSLRDQLMLALQGIVRSKQAAEKPVDLLLDGENKRKVQIAYIVDMPIWRMSYRLAIKDDECELQGWAHVDNATGVDWNEIALDLRSGKPQSFRTDLFNPIAAERTDVGTNIYEF